MPANVTLEVAGRRWQSPFGLVHSFRATDLHAGTLQSYTLTAHLTGSVHWDARGAGFPRGSQ